jgi:hypothetical protein
MPAHNDERSGQVADRPNGVRRGREASSEGGVEANARLTAGAAAVLLLLLAVEGVTVLRVRALLSLHVFIGMVLVPPVLLKIGSTTWRFARYYWGSPAYRRKGPPPRVLRVLGPAVVILTVILLASGVGLVIGPHSERHTLLFIHKASFILWFGVMTIHVLGHLIDTARVAPLDWARRTRRDVAGATARQWGLAVSVVVGAGLGAVMLGPAAHYHHL